MVHVTGLASWKWIFPSIWLSSNPLALAGCQEQVPSGPHSVSVVANGVGCQRRASLEVVSS